MKFIDQAIRLPVTTSVGVILLVLFGVLALVGLPVQLTPNVQQPEITVSTVWSGASPQEIEREIVERLAAGNSGPFPDAGLAPVFREIISATRSLEGALSVAYFGPEGTFRVVRASTENHTERLTM